MKRTMKQAVGAVMALLLVVGSLCMLSCGTKGDEIPENAVYVTISDGGQLVTVRKAVSLSDADGDGATTINDALYLAHDAAYEGGAEAGYLSEPSEYGRSLYKLWGDESGAFGYCINDASTMSLLDAVSVGDHIYAYIYSDQMTWSDAYSYFDKPTVTLAKGETITLSLSYAGYDAAWNFVTAPVADAVLTVDGEETAYVTDAEGRVTLSFDKKGSYIVSASAESLTLVPPVCVVTVK